MEAHAKPDWFESLRRATSVLGGVWIGLWLARILGWIVDLDGAVLGVLALVFAVIGAATGWASARKLQPMRPGERRDAVLGWSIVGALVGALGVAAVLGIFD
jgi:hypothetical protein